MSKRRSAVFFDAGNTLFRPKAPLPILYNGVINEVKGTNFKEEEIISASRDVGGRMPLIVNGYFRYSDPWFDLYIEDLLKSLACPKPWDGIRKGLFSLFDDPDTFEIFPDVLPCLEAVRKAGFKTAVVSNWGFRLPQLMARMGLAHFFVTVLASAEVQSEKPDSGIFRMALASTGTLPEKTLHIGDDPINDVEGARAAGLRSLLLDRQGAFPERPDRLSSLDRLPAYLEDL